MQKTMSRNALYQIDQQIKEMQSQSPAFTLLLSKQIRDFYTKAGMQLKITASRFDEILHKYIQKDVDGKFQTEGEGDNKKWKFITSKVDLDKAEILDRSQVEKAFQEECKKMFDQNISFDW